MFSNRMNIFQEKDPIHIFSQEETEDRASKRKAKDKKRKQKMRRKLYEAKTFFEPRNDDITYFE